jgi:hypothetical protein
MLEASSDDELATMLRFMQAAFELQRRHLQRLQAETVTAQVAI